MPYLYAPRRPSAILTTTCPTMLLTKPLTNFLNANRTPQIHTLLLITPTGKLLSSSSPIPASTLRAHATLACSIWSLYRPIIASSTIGFALPSPPRTAADPNDNDNDENVDEYDGEDSDNQDTAGRHHSPDPDVSSILIQLERGTMLIRALRCSLLFVVFGPSSSIPTATGSSTSLAGLAQGLSYLSVASAALPPASSHSFVNGEGGERAEQRERQRAGGSTSSANMNVNGVASSAASVTGSMTEARGGSIKLLKRQAEELAKWLDGELEGFSLSAGF